jgi:hypothetical protein
MLQETSVINWLQLKTCRKPASSVDCSWQRMCGGGSRQGVRPLGTEQHLNGHWQLVRNQWTHGAQVPLSICQRRQFGYIWRQIMAAQILWLGKIRFYNWQNQLVMIDLVFSLKTSKITFFEFWIFNSHFGHNIWSVKTGWNFSKWHIWWNEDIFFSSSTLYQRSQETIMVFPGGKSSKKSDKLKLNYENRANLAIQGNHGNNSLMLSSNFAIVDTNNHCIFPLSNKRFHVCIGEFQVLLYQCFFCWISKKVIWRFPVARSEEN